MQNLNIQSKIKSLPKTPGVYIFKDKTGAVLYVGKATSLKDRVKSYFVGFSPFGKGGLKGDLKNLDNLKIPLSFGHLPLEKGDKFERPIDFAIGQIKDIKIIETDTVLEAFILEQNLIKKLQPKYNAMGKDDKSFTYAVITKEEFPRILLLRKTELPVIASIAKQSRNIKHNFSKSEIAAIASLPRNDIMKIYGPYTSKKQIEIALKILRKIFPYHSKPQKSEKGCLDFQIGLCPGPYARAITRADYLKNIRGIRMILEGKKKGLVKKLEKEMKKHSDCRQFEDAGNLRDKIFALKHIRDVALISRETPLPLRRLRRSRPLPRGEVGLENTFRIEAYDISNISGQFAVGSMVVFDNSNGEMASNKNEYRKFKIRTIQGADDVGMMKEILTRRFRNDWPKPDLILLDGGKGQFGAGEEVLLKLNLKIPMVAVKKGKDRKIFNLQFSRLQCFAANSESNSKQLKNTNQKSTNSKLALQNRQAIYNKFSMTEFLNEILNDKNLIKRIMDEAHRFAITYHKKVRRKNFI